ncbi:hypothetical protein [Gynuella sunshinyii]|nr:hypothetical protein [Gynuella sunshinyii]
MKKSLVKKSRCVLGQQQGNKVPLTAGVVHDLLIVRITATIVHIRIFPSIIY